MVRSIGPESLVLFTLVVACADDPAPSTGESATETGSDTTAAETGAPIDPCDQDADGVLAIACGGEDCDDEDPAAYPGAPDNSWALEVIDADLVGAAAKTALVQTSDGTLHAVYSDGAEDGPAGLRHATRSPEGAWSTAEIVAPAADLGPPSLAVDPQGGVHLIVSRQSAGTIVAEHGTLAGSSWSFETLAEGQVDAACLAIGPDGTVHVLLRGTQAEYWRGEAGVWTAEPLGPLVSTTLVLGDGDYPDVIGREDTTLRACVRGETEWTCGDVTPAGDPGPYGASNRAVYDAEGVLHLVSVDDVDTERLVHRRRIGGEWSTTMLSFLPRPQHGLDVRWDGEVLHVVAWSEALVEGGAAYARWSGDTWSLDEPIIAGDKLGWEPAMVVDPGGIPHVVYADTLFDDFYYASRTAGDGIDQDCDGQDG